MWPAAARSAGFRLASGRPAPQGHCSSCGLGRGFHDWPVVPDMRKCIVLQQCTGACTWCVRTRGMAAPAQAALGIRLITGQPVSESVDAIAHVVCTRMHAPCMDQDPRMHGSGPHTTCPRRRGSTPEQTKTREHRKYHSTWGLPSHARMHVHMHKCNVYPSGAFTRWAGHALPRLRQENASFLATLCQKVCANECTQHA